MGDSFGSPNLPRRRLLTFKPSSPEMAAPASDNGLGGIHTRGLTGRAYNAVCRGDRVRGGDDAIE